MDTNSLHTQCGECVVCSVCGVRGCEVRCRINRAGVASKPCCMMTLPLCGVCAYVVCAYVVCAYVVCAYVVCAYVVCAYVVCVCPDSYMYC